MAEEKVAIRLTVLEIDLKKIEQNIVQYKKKLKNVSFMAVVKANTYGHGVIEISKLAIINGAQYLGVATIEEGIQIRKSGIDIPILILSAILPEQFQICSQYVLNITISSNQFFKKLCELLDENVLDIHVNIDTGMHTLELIQMKFIHLLKDSIHKKVIIHCANSAASINLPESYFDMVRICLGIYGY